MKKSCTHQLRLVVYLMIYRVFYTSQVVVWDFFHQLHVDDLNLIFAQFVPCIEGPWSLLVAARTDELGGSFQCSTMLSHVNHVSCEVALKTSFETLVFVYLFQPSNKQVYIFKHYRGSAPLYLDDQQHTSCTTCECPWSQSGDLWIQARTIWQDHLWSHFVSPQYRNRFRWRPKKVYSMNYTYIYCNTIACHTAKSTILVLHIPSRWWKKLLEGSGEILHLRGGELCFWR